MYVYFLSVQFDSITEESKYENVVLGTVVKKNRQCRRFSKYFRKLYKEMFVFENPVVKKIEVELLEKVKRG